MSHDGKKKKKRLPDESPDLVSPKRLMTWEGVLSNGVSTGVSYTESALWSVSVSSSLFEREDGFDQTSRHLDLC